MQSRATGHAREEGGHGEEQQLTLNTLVSSEGKEMDGVGRNRARSSENLVEKNSNPGQCGALRLDSCGEEEAGEAAELVVVFDLNGGSSIDGEVEVELGVHGGSAGEQEERGGSK